jgi:hypothetical protein
MQSQDASTAQALTAQAATKPWWKSRTLWFNAICLAAAAAESQLGGLQSVLPGGLYTWLAFILPVGNAALRVITTTAVVP